MILKALTPCFAPDAMYKEIRRFGAYVALMKQRGIRGSLLTPDYTFTQCVLTSAPGFHFAAFGLHCI
jgi:hypothetical protein